MSYTRTDRIQYDDIYNDSFSNLRVSTRDIKFDATFNYGVEEGHFFTTLTGAATATHLPNESAWQFNVTAASGDKVKFETLDRIRHISGTTTIMRYAALLGVPKTNVEVRVGSLDDLNGFFFKLTGSGLFISNRTTTLGGSPSSAVDIDVAQSNWNIDKLDGTGPSGLTLDTSTIKNYLIEYHLDGTGIIRFGVEFSDHPVYVHYIEDSTLTAPYVSNKNLPIRFEIENVGATSSPTSMKAYSATYLQEGSSEILTQFVARSVLRSATTPLSVPTGSFVPIGGLRMKQTLNGVPVTGFGFITSLSFLLDNTNSMIYRITLNPTTVTGASWTSVGAGSQFEVDFAATAISGGSVKLHKWVQGSGGESTDLQGAVFAEREFKIIPGATFYLEARAITGAASIFFAANFVENY